MAIESLLTSGFGGVFRDQSAPSVDALDPSGQGMPQGLPYNARQSSVSTIYQADGTPFKTTARFPKKGDDRSYIDFHNINPFDKVLHTYQCSNGYADNTYLQFFQREDWYDERRKYSPRSTRIFKSIVDSLVTPVYDKKILRTSSDKIYDVFVENCDNAGTPLSNFLMTTQLHAQMLGITFVVMDNLPDASKVESEQQAIDDRKFPYVYEKLPQEIPNTTSLGNGWHTTNWGKLDWICFFDYIEKRVDPKNDKKFIYIQHYIKWDTNFVTAFHDVKDEKDNTKLITVIDSVREHGLGYLPVYPVLDYMQTKSLKKMPTPRMLDLANLAWHLYNVESWITMLAVFQFPMLQLPDMDTNQLAISMANALKIPADAKFPASWINPDPSSLEVLIKLADRREDEIFRAASEMGVSGSKPQTKQMASGVSKEWDFRAKNSMLQSTAQASKNEEDWMAHCFGGYTGKIITIEVNYPGEFCEAYSNTRMETASTILNGKTKPPDALAQELWIETTKVFFDDDPTRSKDIITRMQTNFAQDIKQREQDKQDEKDLMVQMATQKQPTDDEAEAPVPKKTVQKAPTNGKFTLRK